MSKKEWTERDVSQLMPALADGIAEGLKKTTGKDWGFFLMVYPFEKQGVTNYISNTSDAFTIEMMEQHLELKKAGMPVVPAHERQ